MEDYKLEKWVWTEKDYGTMGWHDCNILGIRFTEDLQFDIDYIFKWNEPEIEGLPFTFWIAPCTLIFKQPINLSFELREETFGPWLEIEGIELANDRSSTSWRICTRNGDITFESKSFTQYVRRSPTFQFSQAIPLDERGGISFERDSGAHKVFKFDQNIELRRQKVLNQYELAKKRFLLKKELEGLIKRRETGFLETKSFIQEKNRLRTEIDSISKELDGTRFEQW